MCVDKSLACPSYPKRFLPFVETMNMQNEAPDASLPEMGGALVEFCEILVVTKKRDITELKVF